MGVINDYGMPFSDVGGDRKYSSSAWRDYFSNLLEDGIVGSEYNELKVNPQAVPNKSVYVDTGTIFIGGALRISTSTVNVQCADNASGNPRIDRIVARLNYTDRKIEFAVLQGTPAASPVAPSLTRNTTKWELALADITLANGYSTITVGNITDKREDVSVCGYFRYKAKPAWYPGNGTPARDAWMYTNFKSQLTAQEIADIEANPTLMDIINNNSIANTVSESGLGAETISLSSDLSLLMLGDLNVNKALADNFKLLSSFSRMMGTSLIGAVDRLGLHMGKYFKGVLGTTNAAFDSLPTIANVLNSSTAMGLIANNIDAIIELMACRQSNIAIIDNPTQFKAYKTQIKATLDANPTRVSASPFNRTDTPNNTIVGSATDWVWVETLTDANSSYNFTGCFHNLPERTSSPIISSFSTGITTVQLFGIGGIRTTISNATAASMSIQGTIYSIIKP